MKVGPPSSIEVRFKDFESQQEVLAEDLPPELRAAVLSTEARFPQFFGTFGPLLLVETESNLQFCLFKGPADEQKSNANSAEREKLEAEFAQLRLALIAVGLELRYD